MFKGRTLGILVVAKSLPQEFRLESLGCYQKVYLPPRDDSSNNPGRRFTQSHVSAGIIPPAKKETWCRAGVQFFSFMLAPELGLDFASSSVVIVCCQQVIPRQQSWDLLAFFFDEPISYVTWDSQEAKKAPVDYIFCILLGLSFERHLFDKHFGRHFGRCL